METEIVSLPRFDRINFGLRDSIACYLFRLSVYILADVLFSNGKRSTKGTMSESKRERVREEKVSEKKRTKMRLLRNK